MTIYLFLFGVLLAAGLFFIALELFKLPKLATQKAMLSAGKQVNAKPKFTDVLLQNTASKLSKYIHIDEYKKSRMANVLSAAEIDATPELFTSQAIVKSVSMGLMVIPSLMIMPLLSPVILILAVLMYFKEIRKVDEALSDKRGKIEQELPRFVATITQELKNSRDVLTMIENFKNSAGEEFESELDILTADMRSSSYESALTRFMTRINSPILSNIVIGLRSVLQGDDAVIHFQMLNYDMKELELQRLKAQAMKIPSKIRVFSFAMLICFLLTYIVIIIYEIITSLSAMF